jgi:hypothetical protein
VREVIPQSVKKRWNSAAPNCGPLSDQNVNWGSYAREETTAMADNIARCCFSVTKRNNMWPTTEFVNHHYKMVAIYFTEIRMDLFKWASCWWADLKWLWLL